MAKRALLDWTSHALVDVGIATLCAMAAKNQPTELTISDLDNAADEMQSYYFSGALSSYLSCVFMNSEYVQPGSGQKKDESRRRYIDRVLRAHRSTGDDEAEGHVCAFSNEPATHRIHRSQMPLLTGEDVLNFFPSGTGGLFVAGPYLTAIQSLPLGGRRSEGKLLIAHSDSAELTLAFARKFLEDNRRLLTLALSGQLPGREGGSATLAREHGSWDAGKKRPKYPDAKAAFTLIASDLLELVRHRRDMFGPTMNMSMQVYWLSSSGQGPSLDIFTLPSNLIRFLREVSKADTSTAWNAILAKSWASSIVQAKRSSKSLPGVILSGPGRSRNSALNDLLRIFTSGVADPQRARLFVRRYLLHEDREGGIALDDGAWALTNLFLMEVLGMSRDMIERIRAFADMLANYISRTNNRKFFRAVTFSKRAWEFRSALEKVQRNEYLQNQTLLFGFDEYLQVFESEDNAGFTDWSLMRDLICIRMVEQLHAANWLVPEDLKRDAEQEIQRQDEEAIV